VNFPGRYDWVMSNAILDAEDMYIFHAQDGNTNEVLRWATVIDTLNEVWYV